MANLFQTPAVVDKITTLKDKSIKITLETPELHPESMAKLFQFSNKEVIMALNETLLKEDDLNIPESVGEFRTDKTPSQRLRSVLYVYWDTHKPEKDFDTYYRKKMNEIIDYIKDKLN